MTTATMTWSRLSRRLGNDHNPLRRPADRLQAWLAPVAVALFVLLTPVVSGAAYIWLHAENSAVTQAQHSWREVRATLLTSTPEPMYASLSARQWTTWAPATWTAAGQLHIASVPAAAGTVSGSLVPVWLNQAGIVQAPPLTPGQLTDRVAVDTMIALSGLAVLLGLLVMASAKILDRRRLAGWETAWRAVAPAWTESRTDGTDHTAAGTDS